MSSSWGKDLNTNQILLGKWLEEYAVNIAPYQFEPMASESDGESSTDSSHNNTCDAIEEQIGQVDW